MKVIAEHVAQAKLDVGVFISMLNTQKKYKKMHCFIVIQHQMDRKIATLETCYLGQIVPLENSE